MMTISTRLGAAALATVLTLLAVPEAKAQTYGHYGYGYGSPSYATGYGYNQSYGYPRRFYVQPAQTYNNLNGLAAMINQSVLRRQAYYGNTYRRGRR